jgi:hypothetical protein
MPSNLILSAIQKATRRPGSFYVRAVKIAGTVGEAVWSRSNMEQSRWQERRRPRIAPVRLSVSAQPSGLSIRINRNVRTGMNIASGFHVSVPPKEQKIQ